VEVINVEWIDPTTDEVIIFCDVDAHPNKWGGFSLEGGLTADLADENDNGFLGSDDMFSTDEVLIVLGDVRINEDATLNTNGIKVYYTGDLINDGTIDTPGNVIHVDARHFGDFNGDGVIRTADFSIFRDAETDDGVDTPDPRCDSDGDNDADLGVDYALFLANFYAYGSDSLCSGGESFGGGGSSGCSSEVALTQGQETWVADTIAWHLENLSEELIAAAAEAFAASTAYTSDPAECQMSALVAAGLCGE